MAWFISFNDLINAHFKLKQANKQSQTDIENAFCNKRIGSRAEPELDILVANQKNCLLFLNFVNVLEIKLPGRNSKLMLSHNFSFLQVF